MAALLQSFTAVLDEFGVSYARAKKAALAAAEGLSICGGFLQQTSVNEIIAAIEAFGETTKGARWLVTPMGRWLGEVGEDDGDEVRSFHYSISLRELTSFINLNSYWKHS